MLVIYSVRSHEVLPRVSIHAPYMKFSLPAALFLRAGIILFLSESFGCRSSQHRSNPTSVLDGLEKDFVNVFGVFGGLWAYADASEFDSIHERNWNPVDQSVSDSLLLTIARASFPRMEAIPIRSFLVGETDDPQLYQLMERNFFRVTRRSINGEINPDGPQYCIELFSVSVAFCLNGEKRGSDACIRDFQTMLEQGNHFRFGQSTKFIISDDNIDRYSKISEQVRAWISSVIKSGKDSVIAVKVSRASTTFYNLETMTNEINFDHPVTVYMHFPK